MFGEIANPDNCRAIDDLRRVFGVGVGERLDLRRAVRTFEHQRFTDLQIVTVLGVNIIHQLGQRFADRFGVGRDFGKHQGRSIGVLVANCIRAEVAITFLAAKDEEARIFEAQRAGLGFGERAVIAFFVGRNRFLVFAQFRGDVFKACQRIDDANAEAVGNRMLEFGGDVGFDQQRAVAVGVGQPAELKAGLQTIPSHQRADLVARQKHHLPCRIADGDAHAVGVRIGADHDFRA